jgi:outer membrane lipoprotein-sorting protein
MGPALTPLRIALVVVVAVGAVAAGGAVVLSDETPRPSPEAIDSASERFRSLDGFAATMVSTTTIGNETTRSVRRVTARPGTNEYRAVAVGNTTAGFDLAVSNGTTVWYYDRDNETAQRIRIDGGENRSGVLLRSSYVERLLEAALGGSNESRSGVSTLPMVSAPADRAPSGSLSGNGSSLDLNVSYLGTERVSGRETYVLELTETGDSERLRNYTARVWVDTEWFAPLRQQTNFTVDDQRYSTVTRYRNVSFDPDLSDTTFEFDPPADANVTVETGPSLTRYDSRAALARNASLSVPDPELPGEFRFQQGVHTTGENRIVTLQYTNGTTSFSVTVSNSTSIAATEGQEVAVGSATGRRQTLAGSTFVSWRCDGQAYSVTGAGVGNETVLDVARSVGCD